MQIDYQNSRFRVTKDGTTVFLQGALTDATALNPVVEMAASNLVFDCSKIQMASFSGVVNLMAVLDQHAVEYKLINVPFFFYLTLIVNNFKARVQTAELVCCKYSTQNIEFSINKLERTGLELEWDVQGEKLIAAPSFSEYPDPFQRQFSSTWATENNEEASFWLDYMGFLFNSTSQCEQNIGAAVVALNRYFSLLDIRIDTFSQAWDLMQLPDRKGNWAGKASVAKTVEMGESLLKTVSEVINITKNSLAGAILAATENSLSVKDIFDTLSQFKKNQMETSAFIEANGAMIGDLLMSIESFKHIDKDLAQGLSSLPIEKLPEVLEILGIMNPDAESDPKEAAQEISSEAKMAENDLNSCILILQAFDLVRQTLENRAGELDILLENLEPYKKDEVHWTFIRDSIVDKFSSKFSTDQEKTTFNYYLGYLSKANDQTASDASHSGDILLF